MGLGGQNRADGLITMLGRISAMGLFHPLFEFGAPTTQSAQGEWRIPSGPGWTGAVLFQDHDPFGSDIVKIPKGVK